MKELIIQTVLIFLLLNKFTIEASHAEDLGSAAGRKAKLTFLGFGCVYGFGGFGAPRSPEEEQKCDLENLQKFVQVLGKCGGYVKPPTKPSDPQPPNIYDIDGDDCATCNDFKAWKKRLPETYDLKLRSTNGSALSVVECPD